MDLYDTKTFLDMLIKAEDDTLKAMMCSIEREISKRNERRGVEYEHKIKQIKH